MTDWVVELMEVSFSYDGHEVLRDVSIKVPKGDFLALIGPNGGGKTTLIKICVGLLKPKKGAVNVLGMEPDKARYRIGYVPQDTNRNKDFPANVFDIVLTGRLARKRGFRRSISNEDRLRVENILKKMHLYEYRNRRIGELSGGQRQRVFIARALVGEPEILFMDEPTASVDPSFQTELYELLKKLNESLTIIVVSHDMSVLSSYVKSVACVNGGVFYHGAPELTEEIIGKVYHCPVELIAHGVPHRVLKEHR
ncbi:MAG: ABC transporter ATP-binding protein [Syntrophobacterales bacterium]|nr:ABC transporter ATP-binding protein [Syntrophobacterales bacterium]